MGPSELFLGAHSAGESCARTTPSASAQSRRLGETKRRPEGMMVPVRFQGSLFLFLRYLVLCLLASLLLVFVFQMKSCLLFNLLWKLRATPQEFWSTPVRALVLASKWQAFIRKCRRSHPPFLLSFLLPPLVPSSSLWHSSQSEAMQTSCSFLLSLFLLAWAVVRSNERERC